MVSNQHEHDMLHTLESADELTKACENEDDHVDMDTRLQHVSLGLRHRISPRSTAVVGANFDVKTANGAMNIFYANESFLL